MSKLAADRNQRQLLELVAQPGNDICADCKSKAPRWASHNLGIFICMRCAGIHRKLGTHITKVKSLSLDSWTKEQVESMRSIGNVRSNELWNPDETRNPLPANMEESERDSEMEKFIRSKYQFGRFKSKAAIVQAHLGPSQSKANLPPRSRTAPIRSSTSPQPSPPPHRATPPLPVSRQPFATSTANTNPSIPSQTSTSAVTSSSLSPSVLSSQMQRTLTLPTSLNPPTFQMNTFSQPPAPPSQQASLSSSTFNDLISLQAPSLSSTLPLQYQATSTPPASTYSSLSTAGSLGGLPSSLAGDRSSAFRSASMPVATSSYGQPSPMISNLTGAPNYNPFFPQQQQQQSQPSPFGSMVTSPPAVSVPNPFNPFSQQLAQQQQFGGPSIGFSQMQPAGSPAPISAPQPQPFSLSNGSQFPNNVQQQSQYNMTPPLSGVNPYQSSPSPSMTLMQPQGQMQQMHTPFGQPQQQQSTSPYSQQAQQAQQLFQSMAAGTSGGNRNPFSYS